MCDPEGHKGRFLGEVKGLRILWVKPGKLFPLNTGGKLRSYHILRHLAALHTVTFLSFYGGQRDLDYEAELRAKLPGAIFVHDPTIELQGIRRYLSFARSLPKNVPFSVASFRVPRVKHLLSSRSFCSQFDVAICDFLASTVNFPRSLRIPAVLFQHNVETFLWKQRKEFSPNWHRRLIAWTEFVKMRRYEQEQLCRFDHIFSVSNEDRDAMIAMEASARIAVIPTGVDLRSYVYTPNEESTSPVVVFCGSMDWEPNIDGVEYFCREIWPYILAKVPRASFRIVGRDPDQRVRELASASVEITGTVASVVEHLRQASVLVVPLRIGSGTRIKIYEGMAMGKATVCTRLGAEGLDVHHGRDIFLSNEPRQLAQHVADLLLDRKLRQKCGEEAARSAQQHDWSVVAQIFAHALQNVLTVKDGLFASDVAQAEAPASLAGHLRPGFGPQT
jgi:polysaccharide biosynthesis protein PslH